MDNLRTETPQEAGHRLLRSAGYASGGAVHEDETEDKELIKKELGRARIKVKGGGAVSGKKPTHRPDRRAHRADGGHVSLNGVATVDRRYEAEGIHQPHGPENKRADGGGIEVLDGGGMARSGRAEMPPQDYQRVPHRANGGMMSEGSSRKHGKHGGPKVVNVIVGKSGDDDGKAQMAHQAGMQQGMQLGAASVAQKLAGAGAGGPPRPPMVGPPGMPPPGAMPPGASMARPPMPPPGPQMARDGGKIRVREHQRRKAGGAV